LAAIFARARNGPRTPLLAALALLSSIHVYTKYFRVPAHLRHLPRLGPWKSVSAVLSGKGSVQRNIERIAHVKEDGVRRGLLKPGEEPGLFAVWMLGRWAVGVNNPQDLKDVWTEHSTFEKFRPQKDLADGSTVHDYKPKKDEVFGDNIVSARPADIGPWMQRLTLDALSSAAFGTNLDSVNHPNSTIVQLYNDVFTRALSPSVRGLTAKSREFNEYLVGLIDEKTAKLQARRAGNRKGAGDEVISDEDADSKDLMELMVSAMLDDPEAFSKDDVRNNTMGHDTTANALSFALYLLGMHPDKQQKARERQLNYITYIIKEAMRLYPSVPNTTRQLVSDHTFHNGLKVPRGSLVSVNIWTVHHSPAVWGPTAEQFIPERWADEHQLGSDGTVPMHPGAAGFKWTPFGGGARVCLGQQFSIIEQRVVLAMLLLRYEWKIVGNESALKGQPETTAAVLMHPKDVMIQFTRRN
ncbi:cytochrome P450, partial [Catenaria anguillulae PL171]